MLTGRSDGYKCKPFVLLPRKRPDKAVVDAFKQKLVLYWSGKVWMDDDSTVEYLQNIMGQSLFGRRLLVWDAYRTHMSVATKETLRKLKLDIAVIPGGTTKFIQVMLMHLFLQRFSFLLFLGSRCLLECALKG